MATRHDIAVDTIADWIVSGRYPPGATLPIESAICAELAASRTVVREALKTLASKGMLSISPRVGTRVQPFDNWTLFDPRLIAWRMRAPLSAGLVRDLVELRLMIEPGAAEMAARKATPADVGAIAAALADMVTATDDSEAAYIAADLAFHQSILRAAHNQFLAQLATVIGAVLQLSFTLSVPTLDEARRSLPHHEALLKAIRAGDSARARAVSEAIIKDAGHIIEGLIAQAALQDATS